MVTTQLLPPEREAVRLISHALDDLTPPDRGDICDRTGLSRPEVDHLVEQMMRARGRPPKRPPTPNQTPAPVGEDEPAPGVGGPPTQPAQLITWAINHPDADIRQTADQQLAQLRKHINDLLDNAQERARRARIAELQAELDQLRGVQRVTCPDCGQTGIRADHDAVHAARSRKHRADG